MQAAAVGMVWYRRADYARIREIMVDGESFPITYDRWQKAAENGEADLRRQGRVVVRAHIDPDQFVAWCAASGLDVDAKARVRWANEAAVRALRGEH